MPIANNEALMQFEYSENGQTAYLKYSFYRKKNLALVHTVVPEELKGKGIGSALAEFAFAHAKATKKMVMVYCPFVAGYLKKHPELRKQLNPEYYR